MKRSDSGYAGLAWQGLSVRQCAGLASPSAGELVNRRLEGKLATRFSRRVHRAAFTTDFSPMPMSSDPTEQQSAEHQSQARRLSLPRSQPPGQIDGYELTEFLGSGSYGEVWIGVDANTGRQVAVKFYHDRASVDSSLLSREVEKLVFLSADRYVVQLLDVGWDSDPPYYVMEYIENGSLAQLLDSEGPLSPPHAIELFRETATGLIHAHAKGVLHCDLKPANVLLDQDGKPRIADFGQSRLSHEQVPSLGTLFYMAPEQADLNAVPDAQWDVYALGAMLYCMLTGQPPYRDDTSVSEIESARHLVQRLAIYRQRLQHATRPSQSLSHLRLDRRLLEIIDRCLATEPRERFANVQEILNALELRDQARARLPLLSVGILVPLILTLVMAFFAWRGYRQAVRKSDLAVSDKSLQSNRFAARLAANYVENEIGAYYRAVEQVAESEAFQDALRKVLRAQGEDQEQLARLRRSTPNDPEFEKLRTEFELTRTRQPLQAFLEAALVDPRLPPAASWFVCDATGMHLASAFDHQNPNSTVGRNFAYRTYFHGGTSDLPPGSRPSSQLTGTRLSSPLRSTATRTLKIAVSTPLYLRSRDDASSSTSAFAGVLAVTVEVGRFLREFDDTNQQFATLIDNRPGDYKGTILRHPLLTQLSKRQEGLPSRFYQYRVDLNRLSESGDYRDPFAEDPLGDSFDRTWIAAAAHVMVRPRDGAPNSGDGGDTGLVVLVQEDFSAVIEPVRVLGQDLVREAFFAIAFALLLIVGLWIFLTRTLTQRLKLPLESSTAGLSIAQQTTVAQDE